MSGSSATKASRSVVFTVKYAYFDDPDGNTWALQKTDVRVPPPNPADEPTAA